MMSLVSYQLNSYLLLILEEPNISIDTATYFKTCISKEGCCPTGADHKYSQLHFVSCPGYPMFLRFIAMIMIVDIIQGTWSLRHCCLRKPMLPHNDGHFKGVTCAHAVICVQNGMIILYSIFNHLKTLLFGSAITWLKIIRTSQVGGVLETSGPPLPDGHRYN